MPDFPSTLTSPQHSYLHTFGPTSLMLDVAVGTGGAYNTGAVWPTANLGIFVPVWVEQIVTAYQMGVIVTVQSGNCDVGIFDTAGNAIVRAGATAVAAAGFQAFDITDTILTPGVYFLGMAVDNTTAAFRSVAPNVVLSRAAGVQTMASAYSSGLVATATYAAPSSAYTPALSASLVATL